MLPHNPPFATGVCRTHGSLPRLSRPGGRDTSRAFCAIRPVPVSAAGLRGDRRRREGRRAALSLRRHPAHVHEPARRRDRHLGEAVSGRDLVDRLEQDEVVRLVDHALLVLDPELGLLLLVALARSMVASAQSEFSIAGGFQKVSTPPGDLPVVNWVRRLTWSTGASRALMPTRPTSAWIFCARSWYDTPAMAALA